MSDDFERRVQDAVSAHGSTVHPDESGSLDAIRARAASARRRRLVGASALAAAAALVIGVAIGVSVGDDGGDQTITAGGGSSTTTTPTTDCPPITTGPTTTYQATPSSYGGSSTTSLGTSTAPVTTVPPSTEGPGSEVAAEPACNGGGPTTATTDPPTTPTTPTTVGSNPGARVLVVFPTDDVLPGQPWPWPDAESTAKAFLESIGVEDPALGAYQPSDTVDPALPPQVTEHGTIQVHVRDGHGGVRTDIVRSTLGLVKLDGRWAVTGARSDSIVLDPPTTAPPADLEGDWTVGVRGRGRGFEATLHVRVIVHGDTGTGGSAIAMASGGEELGPFTATVPVHGDPGQILTVVVSNESGETGGPGDITAYAVPLTI